MDIRKVRSRPRLLGVLDPPRPGLDWSPGRIIGALHDKGLSLRQLSLRSGYRPDTLKNVIRDPYPRAARVIARALGVRAEEIWPSLYACRPAAGRRNLRGARPKSRARNKKKQPTRT